MLAQWWCPRPWTTEILAFDLRAGGDFHAVMHGPDGDQNDTPALFLDVVPQERVVFTTCLTAGWRPYTPWLAVTAIFTFADEARGTRYTGRALHPDQATRDKHEAMGFHEGWGACMDHLEAFAAKL